MSGERRVGGGGHQPADLRDQRGRTENSWTIGHPGFLVSFKTPPNHFFENTTL